MKAAATRRAAEEVKDRQNLNCDEACADLGEDKDDCVIACEYQTSLQAALNEFDRMKMKAAATRSAAKDRQSPYCDDTCANIADIEYKGICMEDCMCAEMCGEDKDCWDDNC